MFFSLVLLIASSLCAQKNFNQKRFLLAASLPLLVMFHAKGAAEQGKKKKKIF
jgi:hypothetical protein